MANILTYGETPLWAVATPEKPGYLVNSISFTASTQQYESKGNTGAVIGLLIYDQKIDWQMNTAISQQKTEGDSPAQLAVIGEELTLNNYEQSNAKFNPAIGGGTAATSILLNISESMSAGEARSYDLSGSVYNFAKTVTNA